MQIGLWKLSASTNRWRLGELKWRKRRANRGRQVPISRASRLKFRCQGWRPICESWITQARAFFELLRLHFHPPPVLPSVPFHHEPRARSVPHRQPTSSRPAQLEARRASSLHGANSGVARPVARHTNETTHRGRQQPIAHQDSACPRLGKGYAKTAKFLANSTRWRGTSDPCHPNAASPHVLPCPHDLIVTRSSCSSFLEGF